MPRHRNFLVTCCLLIFLLSFRLEAASAKNLKKQDVLKTMDELFTYHVEYRELTPTLAKRSLKIYIENFDPSRIYLLNSEVKPFFDMRPDALESMITRFYKGDFADYERLNQVITQSIKRARAMRLELRKNMKGAEGEAYASYAKDTTQLKHRIATQFGHFLSQEGFTADLSDEKKERLFTLWDRRLSRMEDQYLATAQQGEHYLTLHMLKALFKSLDAHTCYYSPEEAMDLRTALEKQFAGIGVVLREGLEGIKVVGMIDGGPAKKSGKIEEGDLIISINGKKVKDLSFEEVLDRLKGNKGDTVALELQRGEETNIQVSVKRDKITMEAEKVSYSAVPFGDGIIGTIDLPSFYEAGDGSSCENDLKEAFKQLKRRGNLLGLVIDMRENSGGFLNQAVKVGGMFIANGVIVISKYAEEEIQYLRSIDTRATYSGPLVILTSKASASAAEIVAQALQDYGSALIVGDERTYGKGSIQYQTVTEDHAKAYFKVTVGRYYTASGKSTQIDGVKADITVPSDYSTFRVGEKYLDYPLGRDQIALDSFDALSDAGIKNRNQFQRHYLPYLERKNTYWTNMLPVLREGSKHRLANDKNFAVYLKFLDETETFPPKTGKWGADDLQMAEAVQIIQDMVLMQRERAI